MLQTLRGAHASLKFPFPKFSRTKLEEEGSKDKPRIQRTCHNFWPPALSHQLIEASAPGLLSWSFCYSLLNLQSTHVKPFHASLKFPFPKFSRTKLEEEGPKDKPRIQRTCHNFWPPALSHQLIEASAPGLLSWSFSYSLLNLQSTHVKPLVVKVDTESWNTRSFRRDMFKLKG